MFKQRPQTTHCYLLWDWDLDYNNYIINCLVIPTPPGSLTVTATEKAKFTLVTPVPIWPEGEINSTFNNPVSNQPNLQSNRRAPREPKATWLHRSEQWNIKQTTRVINHVLHMRSHFSFTHKCSIFNIWTFPCSTLQRWFSTSSHSIN